MIVRRVGILSLGKVLGALYALLGLIVGAFNALFWLFAAVIGFSTESGSGEGIAAGTFSLLFGVGSIIFFPILLGIAGFLGGLLTALIYNAVARSVGGIEVDVDQKFGSRPL